MSNESFDHHEKEPSRCLPVLCDTLPHCLQTQLARLISILNVGNRIRVCVRIHSVGLLGGCNEAELSALAICRRLEQVALYLHHLKRKCFCRVDIITELNRHIGYGVRYGVRYGVLKHRRQRKLTQCEHDHISTLR